MNICPTEQKYIKNKTEIFNNLKLQEFTTNQEKFYIFCDGIICEIHIHPIHTLQVLPHLFEILINFQFTLHVMRKELGR